MPEAFNMSKVYIAKADIPPFEMTWSLIRVEDKRGEAYGFKTVTEAKVWAKKWGHEVVTLTPLGVR